MKTEIKVNVKFLPEIGALGKTLNSQESLIVEDVAQYVLITGTPGGSKIN